MILSKNRSFWAVGLLAVSALLSACEQPGEALIERKKRENEADILAYIAQNNLNATKTDEGIWYFQTKANATGQAPLTGDEVKYHFVARRLDGVIVDSTDQAGNKPETVILAGTNTIGITLGKYAGILKLKQGEEGAVLVPAYLDGGRNGNLVLPQYSPVRYDLKIVSVRNQNQQIQDYIRANNLTVTTLTTDSVRVIKTLTQPADSMAIVTGKTVTMKYVGKRLNGTTFDSNTAGTFKVQIGTKQVVPGFESGLTALRAGEKATIIFPSSLGYGTTGTGSGANRILPYTPLLFELEIVKVE
ncbi:FKBP-type peptidyl-prolyl cis-trans isomerase [Spirosoma sp. 209]|uniref:FKBP-type peptidyl-prolyl cis-trans isomerase n=1 Tax=Spirosoma sp. 209 TaxID=1955701 RepID=UPI00098D0008|nr:FKBP-type peptidyl-prolyl cis-trans isomerase [Spirosoma sp. 209]